MDRSTVRPDMHTKRSPVLLALAAALALLPAGVLAQPASPEGQAAQERRELRQDRRELRQDRGETAGDVAEVRQLQELLRHLDDAHARGDGLAEDRNRREVRSFLQRETADARRDLRDHRRDRRDDARDLAGSGNRFDHERDILAELRGLQPDIIRGNARAEARERQLLGDFLALTKQDARSAARETRQDRRELRQDRRERRQDLEEGGAK